MKRIALCFDGTWNTPSEPDGFSADARDDDWYEAVDENAGTETNVCRLYRSIIRSDGSGEEQVQQIKWYDKGVGTSWYDKLAGGVTGLGLSRNIVQGYRWLSDHYEPGDEVFVFGFSRGAYTARSLVGFIRNAGLLRPGSPDELIEEAYALYRNRDRSADSDNAEGFRRRNGTRIIPIKLLGVWDTVGALGVPVGTFDAFNREFFEFHDTELSSIVEKAYHAIAVDEHRENYAATLWDPKEKHGQVVEQRWFLGAHSDVGGGYDDRRLSDITLRWMQQKAGAAGLQLDPRGDAGRRRRGNPGADRGFVRKLHEGRLPPVLVAVLPRRRRDPVW